MSLEDKNSVRRPLSEDPSSYIFTPDQDWFGGHIDAWRRLFPCVASSTPRVLEIGSWEGRSAVFLLNDLCSQGGSITCIDHFDLLNTNAGRERLRKLTHNLSVTKKPFRIIDAFSVPALMTLLEEEITAAEPGFDWVYVDGSHEADDTFLDAELAWRLTRKGAIFIFDDYHWNVEPADSIHHPKRGIDSFMQLHRDEFNVLSSPEQYQMVLRKKTDMRIGFLTKETANQSSNAFGYGTNIALTADTAFAMPVAVAIQSIISHTEDRVSFYIVDLGLSAEDKDKIQALVSNCRNITLQFLRLPTGSLTGNMGPVWAKIDMIHILPVQRVLYLDGDVLIRTDIRELWETDLQGKSIGAAADVGHPMGHADIERAPYFNAGVIIMDLVKVRGNYDKLIQRAEEGGGATYKEQDVLNAHFRDDWYALPLRWNAQGLGTYAKYHSEDRDPLGLAQMEDPVLVHFTGPVNPSMDDVLNKWVQPYTAKPWGYAGAPGHPFAEEWWKVLDLTGWKGWKSSDEYKAYCAQKMEEAVKVGTEAFHRRFHEVGATISSA